MLEHLRRQEAAWYIIGQLSGFRARSHELRGFCRAGHAVAPVGTDGHTHIQPSAVRWVNRVVSFHPARCAGL